MKSKWSVLALYEDANGRQLAVEFCDGLVQRFWSEHGFEIGWCHWAQISEPVSLKESAEKARAADFIVVAPGQGGNIPALVKRWLELVLRNRGEREGVLVGLAGYEPEHSAAAAASQAYLRKLAHESSMDYLTTVPECLTCGVPESTDAFAQRATEVTSTLDGILSYSPLPPPAP